MLDWLLDLLDNDYVYWVIILVAAALLYRRQRRKRNPGSS